MLKQELKLIVLIIFFTFLFTVVASAETISFSSKSIILDGDFEDWNGTPYYEDSKHDIKDTSSDFLGINYTADDTYLYLKVERLAAEKSDSWKFSVVIINALKGNPIVQYPYGENDPIYAPQFDVETSFIDNASHNGAVVEISFEGQTLERTFSSDNNAKVIEFRVPLSEVGLDGKNKTIEFMLKSEESEKKDEATDWVADGRSIIITTGPTLWKISYLFLFAGTSFAAYKLFKKRNTDIRSHIE